MAALFTTPKRNDTTARTHVAEPDVRRRIGLAHGSWRRVTRRIVAGAVCALTVSSLLMPSVSLAAEWVKVGGNKYNTAASDEAGTWSWDGADDLKLNNYNGGEIQAAGKLNVNYSGTNIVTAEWIESINVSHGTNENAELNIQGDEGGTLSVTSTEDAILSTGNINIDGAGSVNATSTGFDAINAGGDLAIKGSGNVNATGASDGIRANGNITIDDSGAVTARATKDKGIGADKNLTIKGGGTVEASSADGEALWSGGNINISDGSQVKASSEKDAAVEAKGSLAATNASLNVNGVEYGVYAHKGITLDHANVTVRASKGRYGGANALFTYQDDIVVKNGSTVDAFAEGCILHQKRSTQREGRPHLHQRLRCQGHSPLCRERRRPHPLQRKPRWRDEARTPRREHRHHRPDQRGRHTRSHLDHPQQGNGRRRYSGNLCPCHER